MVGSVRISESKIEFRRSDNPKPFLNSPILSSTKAGFIYISKHKNIISVKEIYWMLDCSKMLKAMNHGLPVNFTLKFFWNYLGIHCMSDFSFFVFIDFRKQDQCATCSHRINFFVPA